MFYKCCCIPSCEGKKEKEENTIKAGRFRLQTLIEILNF